MNLSEHKQEIKNFINEIFQTRIIVGIEKDGEKILPIIFYGKNRNPKILEYNKKIFNYLGINMNYLECEFPMISHGQAIDNFIRNTIQMADYWIFMENDSIPLTKNIIDIAYEKIKDKNTIFGGAHQSNHKTGPDGTYNHPYVGPSFHCISKELYFKLGCPKYDDVVNPFSDTAEQITYEAERLGYNICLIWPRTVMGLTEQECIENNINPKYKFSDLGNGQKFGFGTQYGDIYYHQMCCSVQKHEECFLNKCKHVIGESIDFDSGGVFNLGTGLNFGGGLSVDDMGDKLENWIKEIGAFFPPKLEAFKGDIQNKTRHVEHYKILKELSDKYENEIILDIGTDIGVSALVLGINGKNKVISFDIQEFEPETKIKICEKYKNIEFKIQNLLDIPNVALFKEAKIIYCDLDPHNAVKEKCLFDLLEISGFRGILVVDDIHLNSNMESFWNNITKHKEDMTDRGHVSGTGLIYFE